MYMRLMALSFSFVSLIGIQALAHAQNAPTENAAIETLLTETVQTAQLSPPSAPIQHQFPLHDTVQAKKDFSIDYSGFIRWDGFYNTRQTAAAREGLLYLYPSPVKLNDQQVDENADPQINMLSVFTRGAIKVQAPPIWGADLSGLVEADFFGHLNSTISNLRLRHAYLKLHWDHLEVMAGQYWDPFTQVDFFPGVLNPGVGQPLQPFSRNPGLFLNYLPMDQLRLSTAVTMQRDAFSEFGAKNDLQQHSGLPALSGSLTWLGDPVQIGVGALGKAIRPAAGANNLYSGAMQAFGNWKITDDLRLRGRVVFGSDLADHQMLGGFVQTNDDRYLNLSSWASWLDLEYAIAPQWKLGLFGGYTANLGTLGPEATAKTFTARDPEQAWSAFVVPRIVFDASKNLRLALELNWAQSLYTKSFSPTLQPQIAASDSAVDNLHFALTSMLLF